MAAPNIVNVSSIFGKTVGANLTTSSASIVTCTTNKVLKINSIIVSNVDGNNAVDVTVFFFDISNQTQSTYALASTISVPADSTLVVLSKDTSIYLEEGDSIQAFASATNDAQIIISYEELDDA